MLQQNKSFAKKQVNSHSPKEISVCFNCLPCFFFNFIFFALFLFCFGSQFFVFFWFVCVNDEFEWSSWIPLLFYSIHFFLISIYQIRLLFYFFFFKYLLLVVVRACVWQHCICTTKKNSNLFFIGFLCALCALQLAFLSLCG